MNTFEIIDIGTKNPAVNIAMVTYNHGKYMREALDSILMQKTDYSYKIVVAEDCSTDDTREILLKYQSLYPDKFRLILQNKNVGAQQNNSDLLNNLDGQYIAALEGDDYWTDPYKLQKQVDFLERNKNFSGCFSSVNYVDSDGKKIGHSKPLNNVEFNFQQIVQQYTIHTVSLVLRNELDSYFLSNISKYPYGDLPLSLHLLTKGNFHYINSPMASYRKNVGVMQHWNAIDGYEKKAFILESILTDYNLTLNQKIATKWSLAHLYLKLSKHYSNKYQIMNTIKNYSRFLSYAFYGLFTERVLSISLKDVFRPLYRIIRN